MILLSCPAAATNKKANVARRRKRGAIACRQLF
jgi:hypothetical protein